LKQKYIIALVSLFILASMGLVSSARAFVWEDFEQADAPWATNKFGGSLLTDGQISTDFASSGKSSYRGHFTFPAKGGRAAFTTLVGGDLSGLSSISLDIYNSSPLTFEGFLVYKSGPDWKWHESTKFKLKSGWNKDVTITVNGTGAANIQGEFLESIREMDIVLDATESGEGYLYLDNIRLEGPDAAKFAKNASDSQVTGQEVLLAGFEGLNSVFSADSWSGSSSTGVEMVAIKTTEGVKAGRFTFDSKVPDDKPSYTMEADLDMTGASGVKFDVYNPQSDDVDAAIAISTGEWVYHESISRTLKPGWNLDVTFPVRSKNYKCATSNWANSTAVANLSHTRKISILFMPHVVGQGYFLVDKVRVVADDAKKFTSMLKSSGIEEVPVPKGTDRLLEGFEGDSHWIADSSASGAVSATVVNAKTSQGSKVLECSFEVGGTRKNAFFGVESKMNLAGVEVLKVDIYNPMKEPLQAEMAIIIGDQFQWFESRLTDLKPGWNMDVTFPLNTASFKSASSQWKNKIVPGPLSKVRKLLIGVYSNNPLSGKVYMDNVRVTAPSSFVLKTTKAQARKPVTGREVIFDPLQSAAGGWQADQLAADDSFSVAVNYMRKDGIYALKMRYRTATEQQKGMFFKEGQFDWTSVTGFRFDVYNPQNHPVELSLALQTGSQFIWHESERILVKPGWNHDITFAVSDPVWKTAQSNWTNTDNLANPEDVRRVTVIVYPNHGEQGAVFMSHVRTVERDLFGQLGSKGAGKLLGVSDRSSVKGTFERQELATGFENGTTNATSSFSGIYNSQGQKSWKVPYITHGAGTNNDIMVSLPAAFQDLRAYQALMFDFYNPGPPQNLNLGFKTTAGAWYGYATSVTLATGWNRDVTIPLTGPVFSTARTGQKVGSTLEIASHVDELHFQMSGPSGRTGAYLDNLRVVGGALKMKGAVTATEDLQLKFNPSEAVQLLVGGTAWKNDQSHAGGDLTKVQLDARGLNQEFRASVGSAMSSTDDPMKLLDASVLGSSVYALSERATVKDTTVNVFGFARTGDRPMVLGSDGAWGARLSQTLFGDYMVGAGILDHRFGNVPGSSPFTADVESNIKTVQVDTKGYIRKMSLTYEGEIGRSYYDEYEGTSYGVPDKHKDAYHVLGTWSGGPIKLSAGREEKETGFYSPYSTQNNSGYIQNHGEVDYQLDTLKPIKALRQKGGFFGDLVENLKFYTQYYDWHVRTTTYQNFGIRSVLETNDYKTPLYLKAWWYWYNEGKDAGDSSLDNPLLSTHQLEFTQNLEARYRVKPNFYINALGRLASSKYWEATTGAAGLKYRFWGDTSLNGDVKYVRMAGSRYGDFFNGSAGITKRIRTQLMVYELSASYGTSSFTGYWEDDANLKTLPLWNLTLSGRF
jgi:hypothetical protein